MERLTKLTFLLAAFLASVLSSPLPHPQVGSLLDQGSSAAAGIGDGSPVSGGLPGGTTQCGLVQKTLDQLIGSCGNSNSSQSTKDGTNAQCPLIQSLLNRLLTGPNPDYNIVGLLLDGAIGLKCGNNGGSGNSSSSCPLVQSLLDKLITSGTNPGSNIFGTLLDKLIGLNCGNNGGNGPNNQCPLVQSLLNRLLTGPNPDYNIVGLLLDGAIGLKCGNNGGSGNSSSSCPLVQSLLDKLITSGVDPGSNIFSNLFNKLIGLKCGNNGGNGPNNQCPLVQSLLDKLITSGVDPGSNILGNLLNKFIGLNCGNNGGNGPNNQCPLIQSPQNYGDPNGDGPAHSGNICDSLQTTIAALLRAGGMRKGDLNAYLRFFLQQCGPSYPDDKNCGADTCAMLQKVLALILDSGKEINRCFLNNLLLAIIGECGEDSMYHPYVHQLVNGPKNLAGGKQYAPSPTNRLADSYNSQIYRPHCVPQQANNSI